jgi:2-hydroxychromene-2-carboxylate isomerase
MRFPEPEEIARRLARWREMPQAREELPARAYYAALGSGREDALDRALFRAGYVDGRDVNDESVLRDCLESAGLDPEALLGRARGEGAGRRAVDALAAFDRDECPGVPTWVVDGERFWGKDRVDWLVEKVRSLGREGDA